MSNVKRKIKKCHFVALTRIVSTQTNQSVFLYCTVLTIVVSTYPQQQLFNMATTHCTCHTCSSTFAPLHQVSVESLVQHVELVQVNLPQYPQGSDTPETLSGPTEKIRVVLNPAIVEAMQPGCLGLPIST